jgi:hypothetical protein
MKSLTITTLLFLLIGCKSYENGIENITFSIAPNPAVIDIAKIFKQISPIQLTGTDLPLAVYRVLPNSGGYYMLDGKKQSVLSTDGDGKILKVLNAVGDGPGEYKEVWDMKINPDSKDLYILDRKSAKMLVYSASLDFIKEIPIKREFVVTLLSFVFINGVEVLFHSSGTSGYRFLKYRIASNNFEFKVPIDKEFEGLGFGNDKSMTILKDQLSVIYPLNKKIERYDQSLQRKEDLFVDVQGFMIDESELMDIGNDQNRMFDLIQNDEKKKAHSFGLIETDRYYVISYYLGSFRNGDYLKSLVEKASGVSTTWKSITIDQLEVDLLLIGKNKSNELIFTLNSEQLERMTPAQLQVLSKKLKTPIDQNKPLLIFCTPK